MDRCFQYFPPRASLLALEQRKYSDMYTGTTTSHLYSPAQKIPVMQNIHYLTHNSKKTLRGCIFMAPKDIHTRKAC